MTSDDIALTSIVRFPMTAYAQEKIDGANLRVSWFGGPVLGNRDHILQKAYDAKTSAKKQYIPAWNWVHAHETELKNLIQLVGQITIYGEWMLAQHSIGYDKLADYFMAYDIWSVEENRFYSPSIVEDLLKDTSIKYIMPKLKTFASIEEIVAYSEQTSAFRDGKAEGVVIKTIASAQARYVESMFKVVNKYFVRNDNFNDREIIKNKLLTLA